MTPAPQEAPLDPEAQAMQFIDELLAGVRVTIDGVTYVACPRTNMTFERRVYLQLQALEAGLEDPARLMSRTATLEQNVKPLVMALYRSKRMFDFLAGSLVKEGEEWIEEGAKVTALRLRQTKDFAVQTNLDQLIGLIVASFFMVGRYSYAISPSASPAMMTTPLPSDPSAAPFDSGSTAASSAGSLATTPTG